MKIQELRIGNYLMQIDQNKEKEITEVWGIINDVINPLVNENYHGGAFGQKRYYQGWNYEPIPLNEDWLLKFGMEYYDGFSNQRFIRLNKHECDFSKLTYSHKEGLLRFTNGEDKGTSLIPYVKYVHQLQNLYYALTGEELTINEI